MPFSAEDRCAIKFLRENKRYSARRFIAEFPNKQQSRSSLDKLLKKIDLCNTIDRKSGSGRKRTVRTAENI